MSQILSPGNITFLPFTNKSGNGALANQILNATGETCQMIGYIMLENPLGGSKTISAAGGGSITWRASTVTFASGTSVFDVGIQDVSTSSSPAQGDGVMDAYGSYTAASSLASNTTYSTAMSSGTKTIAHGDLIAITMAMTTLGGADSVAVACNGTSSLMPTVNYFPCVMSNTSGAYLRQASTTPNAYITFDDGTVGWFFGSAFNTATGSNATINSETDTADEYGNYIKLPATFYALGIMAFYGVSGTSADLELLLYTDPLGTPAVVRAVTVDATQASVVGVLTNTALFTEPYLINANTEYAITLRPTTVNNISHYYSDTNSETGGGKTGYPNANCHAIRRLDNTGAFSDFNGGTAKTRLAYIALVGAYIEQGVNFATSQIGM